MLLRCRTIPGVVALAAAACGGHVVVDGAGGSGGTTTTLTTTSTVSTSVTSTGGPQICAAACAALEAKGCVGAPCGAVCLGAVTGPCADLAIGLLTCVRDQAAGATGCLVDPCVPFRQKLEACATASSCSSQVLDDGNLGMCVGKGICGTTERGVECDVQTGACTCMFGNGPVGMCQEAGPFLCDFADGCCTNLFPMGG
jgi:hypothetical protein